MQFQRTLITSLLLITQIALGAPDVAGQATADQGEIRFRQFTVEDGLPGNEVRWMIQDRLGFLWLSTRNGLVRYDGYEFKTYTPESDNPGSLSDGNLMEMVEDKEGDLWIGTTSGGLNKFNRRLGTFDQYRNDPSDPNSLSSDAVFTLHLDSKGIL